jgi:hypothetical protein
MKTGILFILLFSTLLCTAQKKPAPPQKLYYFYGKDSLLGVRNGKGQVIIPANFHNLYIEDISMPIEEDIIYMEIWKKGEPLGKWTNSYFFNRKGEFLFHPYWFDNGPDGLQEGLMRYIENNKIGFADRDGKKVIPAKWDYAEFFIYGLTYVCNGCSFYQDTTKSEHNIHLTDGNWGIINKKGEVLVEPGKLQASQVGKISDSLLSKHKLFTYSGLEKKILTKIESVPDINKWLLVNWSNPSFKSISFQIVERPSKREPYYLIRAYGHYGDYLTVLDEFLAAADGTKLYYSAFDEHGKPQLLEEWIAEAKEYEKKKNNQ